jgi:hypothetical protein
MEFLKFGWCLNMPYVEVWIDPEEIDLTDVDTENLLDELRARQGVDAINEYTAKMHLERIYEHYVREGNCPDILKQYFYDMLGRII